MRIMVPRRTPKKESLQPLQAALYRVTILTLVLMLFSENSTAYHVDSSCWRSFSKTIPATQIKHGHLIYFSYDELFAYLGSRGRESSNIQIESTTLQLLVRGKHSSIKEISLAINGIRAVHPAGKPVFTWFRNRDRDSVEIRAELHPLKMNAVHPCLKFFERVFKSKGNLVLWVLGPIPKHMKIIQASLVINGTRLEGNCLPEPSPVPSPIPSPAPIAPRIEWVSIQPQELLTRSASETFAFNSDQTGVNFFCSLNRAEPSLCASPMSYSGLSSGIYHFEVFGSNTAGLSSTVLSYDWEVDTQPPEVTIDSVVPADPVTAASSLEVKFSSSKTKRLVEFRCSLDGQASSLCVSPTTFSGITEGDHTLDISGTDSLGNTSSLPAHYIWRVDQTPPQIQLTQVVHADPVARENDPTFTFQASESSVFQCALDEATFTDCSSPVSYQGLAPGLHQFQAQATDAAGNKSEVFSYQWAIDQDPPSVIVDYVLPSQGLTNSPSVSVNFRASEPATFSCSLDGGVASPCISPWSAMLNAEGAHQLMITAQDMAGNPSSPVQVNWIMDFSAPMIGFGEMKPSASNILNSAQLTVDVIGSETVAYRATLDGVALAQSQPPFNLVELGEGAHVFSVQATDLSGNVSAPIVHGFTVDTIAPLVQLTSAQQSTPTRQLSNSFTFTANEAASFECDMDHAGFSTCTSPFSVSSLAEGIHNFSVRAQDPAGNVSTPASYSWTVDLTPPLTTLVDATPPGNVITTSTITLQFSVNDRYAQTYCSLDGMGPLPCSGTFTTSDLKDGTHSISVFSVDQAGNTESPPAYYNFSVDTKAPTMSLGASVPALTNSRAVQFTFRADEPSVFDCSLDGSAISGCLSPLTFSMLSEGIHVFSISARDLHGNQGSPATFSWQIDLTPPTVVINMLENPMDLSARTFLLSSNDFTSGFLCALDTEVLTPCGVSVSYSGLTDGKHAFKAMARDQAGNSSAMGDYPFEVQTAVLTSITSVTPSATMINRSLITFGFSSNMETATFLCSLDGGAASPCASSATFSGLADGSHQLRVQAISPSGLIDSTGATYSWTVDTIAPVITSAQATPTQTTITLHWTTTEPATSVVYWGLGPSTSNVLSDEAYVTDHVVTIQGLSPLTVYSYIISGKDKAENAYSSPTRAARTTR